LSTARGGASGGPAGFPENAGANLPLMRPLMTLGAVLCWGLASIVFAWFSGRRVSDSGRVWTRLLHFLGPAGLSFGSMTVGSAAGRRRTGGGLTLHRKAFADQNFCGQWFDSLTRWCCSLEVDQRSSMAKFQR